MMNRLEAPDLTGIVNGGDVSNAQIMAALRQVMEYQVQLTQQINYMFSNIGIENLDSDLQSEITMAGDAEKTLRRVEDAEGNVMRALESAALFQRQMEDVQNNVSAVMQTATAIQSTVSSHTTDISTIKQTATAIQSTVSSHTTDISTIKQTATSLETRVRSAEGNISTVTQKADSLGVTVSGINGDVADLKLTTSGLKLAIKAGRVEFDAQGLKIFNGSEAVFRQGLDGKLFITDVYANTASIGGLLVNDQEMSFGSLFKLSYSGNYVFRATIGAIFHEGLENGAYLYYGDPESPVFSANQNGFAVNRWM